MAFESTRGADLPMSFQSFGSLSGTSAGTGRPAAAAASSPNVALRPLAAWDTTPFSTVRVSAGTAHLSAAAERSIARPVAPALRSCAHEFAIALLPPVPCTGPQERLL